MVLPFNFTASSVISDAIFGLNLLTTALSGDVVGVFDQQTLQQVFGDARPVKATVKETARVMDYPVETGATLSDHKVINPTEVEMIFIVPADSYATAYQQMRNAWINDTLLSVQTKTGVYENMIISDMPHEENPEMFDAVVQVLRLREVIFVAPNTIGGQNPSANYAPRVPTFTDTISRGFQAPITLATSVATYVRAASVWGL